MLVSATIHGSHATLVWIRPCFLECRDIATLHTVYMMKKKAHRFAFRFDGSNHQESTGQEEQSKQTTKTLTHPQTTSKPPWQLVDWHLLAQGIPRIKNCCPEQIEGCQPKDLAPPRRHPDLQVSWRWRTSSCGMFEKTRSLSLSKYIYIRIYNIQ